MRFPTYTKVEPCLSLNLSRTGLLQRKCGSCGQHTVVGEACEECQEKQRALQRRAINKVNLPDIPPMITEVLQSPGYPLDPSIRTFMESRFGQDFSQVRIHTDAKAANSAKSVNALAYTVKRDIAFASGRYAPQTPQGQKLLAHELTHVLQQHSIDQEITSPPASVSHENEADQIAQAVMARSQIVVPQVKTGTILARTPDDAEKETRFEYFFERLLAPINLATIDLALAPRRLEPAKRL